MRRERRGAVLLLFLLFALPLIWLSGAISVDYAQIARSKNFSLNVSDAAAIAAANQLTADATQVWIDPTRARDAAEDVVCTALGNDVASSLLSKNNCQDILTVTFNNRTRPTSVEVKLDYLIDGLMLLDILAATGGSSGSYSQFAASVTSSAFLCSSDDSTINQSSCVRAR